MFQWVIEAFGVFAVLLAETKRKPPNNFSS
jgi:hypothetical protein